jgi:hypothetical protein
MKSPHIVAAQVLVLVNGRVFGEVTDWSFNSSTPNTPNHGIDTQIAYDFSPGFVIGQGTIAALRLHNSGGLEGRGVAAPLALIPTEQYFSMLLVNRRNRSTIWRSDYCKVDGQVMAISARERAGLSFQFKAINWQNEVDDVISTFTAVNAPRTDGF